MQRQSTGIASLDELLGGGLIPGTLTVVMGATGIGKNATRPLLCQRGKKLRRNSGASCLTSPLAATLKIMLITPTGCAIGNSRRDRSMPRPHSKQIWDPAQTRRDYLHIFQHSGKRVTATDMDSDQWREWKYEQAKKLDQAIAFFYGNFVHGVRRCVIDGVEPALKAADSIQLELFEYVYHQILRKEHDWVARDLFRVGFRENQSKIDAHAYNHSQLGCLLLYTSHEVMLDDLITRPIESGDVLSNANTIILMGEKREKETKWVEHCMLPSNRGQRMR